MAHLVVAASGYSGSLGLLVTAHARERGHKVTELPGLQDQAAVRAALARTDAVVLIPRRGNAWQHANGAVHTLTDAADALDTAPHLVLLSSFAVGHGPMHPLNRTDPSLLPGRTAAEHATRNGRLPYTIVRPVWFSEDPAGSHALMLTQDPRTDGMISRADLAAALIAAVEQPAARGTTFGLYNEPGQPLTDWASVFAKLRPDDVRDTDNRTERQRLGSTSVPHPRTRLPGPLPEV